MVLTAIECTPASNPAGGRRSVPMTKTLFIMKWLAILLFVATLPVSAKTYSQRVTLSLTNVRLKTVFLQIHKQTGYDFLFSDEVLEATKPVTVKVTNAGIREVLDLCFRNQPLTFTLENNIIIVRAGPAPAQPSADPVLSPPIDVRGRVLNEKGEPLAGATVSVKGTRMGTVTDSSGAFHLSVPDKHSVLVFSYVGFDTEERVVGNNNLFSISLKQKSSGINEVVVVGYGIQKKLDLTGVVSTVESKDLTNRPATNVTALLEGQASGVYVTQPSGQPGLEGSSVLIRGLGTMNNATPLYIVDGLEASSINDINPNDIKSISILKDAAAAAIYGSTAANGVIIVTTKRGQAGPVQVAYNSYFGKQRATYLPQHASSAEYAMLLNEANTNSGLAPAFTDAEISKYRSGEDPFNYPNTDWVGLLLQGSGFTQDHNLSFSGGNDASAYRVSLEYYDQAGLMKYTNAQRYNLRINQDSRVNRWLKIGLNAGLSRTDNVSPVTSFASSGIGQFFRQANMIPPTIANKYPDGTFQPWTNGNPNAWLESGGADESLVSHVLGSFFASAQLMPGLSLKGIAGTDYTLIDEKIHMPTITYGNGFQQGPNSVTDQTTRIQVINLQGLLNYEKGFGKHNIRVLLGAERQAQLTSFNGATRVNFPSNELVQLDAGSTTGWTNSGHASQQKLGSYFGRINYNYNDEFLFEANLRRDGSSKFADVRRWGIFPSFSAGWNLTRERFLKPVAWLDNLKLRASWGQLGNNKIGDYLYISTITLGQNYPFAGAINSGAATTVASNPDVTWETTTEKNIGVDAGFFHNGLLSLTFDYYDRYTDAILTTVPVSAIFGLAAPTVNGGAMRNRGVELQIAHRNTWGVLRYGISLNASYNKNLVEQYANPSKGSTIIMKGIAFNSYYGYQAIGKFQSNADAQSSPHEPGLPVMAGDLKFRDQNQDGVIDDNDRVVLGNSIPKYTYGVNINLGYRNFDFSVFFQGVAGVDRTLGSQIAFPFADGGSALKMQLDRTQVQDGVVVKEGHYPRTLPNGLNNLNTVMSSFLVYNSSYLRMKNIQLGYTLPVSLTKKMDISSFRIYFSGQNLLTKTRFPTSFDPEVGDGAANQLYPQVAFYTFGVNIGL